MRNSPSADGSKFVPQIALKEKPSADNPVGGFLFKNLNGDGRNGAFARKT
jgi:hypothetical protein